MGYAVLFFAMIIFDQVTKAVAFALYDINNPVKYWIQDFLGIDTLINKGMSFGVGSETPWALPVFIIMTVIALIAIAVFMVKVKKERVLFKTSLSLIAAGAVGNLIDRCVMKGVRDLIYMNFGITQFSNNIADIVIFIGAVLLIISLLFVDRDLLFSSDKKEKSEQETAVTAEESVAVDRNGKE